MNSEVKEHKVEPVTLESLRDKIAELERFVMLSVYKKAQKNDDRLSEVEAKLGTIKIIQAHDVIDNSI